jgi:flagellar biogenesis protein FliO
VRAGTPIGIGTSIVLITVGAILKYAITEGNLLFLDIQAAGTILLIIGILGLVLAIAWTIMISNRERPVAYDDRREIVREREREYEEPTRRRERY